MYPFQPNLSSIPTEISHTDAISTVAGATGAPGSVVSVKSTSVLSIVLPIYNELETLRQIVAQIEAIGIDHEIILVDDGSTDGNRSLLEDLDRSPHIHVVRHLENHGKRGSFKNRFLASHGSGSNCPGRGFGIRSG
jgi:hypothetical protein